MTGPVQVIESDLEVDYGHFYVYAESSESGRPGPIEVTDATVDLALDSLNDALVAGRSVGVAGNCVTVTTPMQYSEASPVRIEMWTAEPPDDLGDWDDAADVDLNIHDGRVYFEASGGMDPSTVELPSGTYRARIAARGYDQAQTDDAATFRIQLWPREHDGELVQRKQWQA